MAKEQTFNIVTADERRGQNIHDTVFRSVSTTHTIEIGIDPLYLDVNDQLVITINGRFVKRYSREAALKATLAL